MNTPQRTEAVPETPHASDGLTLDDFSIQGLVGEGEFGKVRGASILICIGDPACAEPTACCR